MAIEDDDDQMEGEEVVLEIYRKVCSFWISRPDLALAYCTLQYHRLLPSQSASIFDSKVKGCKYCSRQYCT